MKKITLLILFILSTNIFCISYAQLSSKVDERFELTSIVFRLAEGKEYVNNETYEATKHTFGYWSDNV